MVSQEKKLQAAKVFGIDASRPEEPVPPVAGVDIYTEDDPTVAEWLAEITPSLGGISRYFYKLFPFISWIGKYNWTWFLGDLIAGELHPCRYMQQPSTKSSVTTHMQSSSSPVQTQAPRSAPSSSPRVWLMPSWLRWMSSMVYTRPSWASCSTGSLPRQRTSPSGYVSLAPGRAPSAAGAFQ